METVVEPLTNRPLTERPAWKDLQVHFQQNRELHLRQLFAADRERGKRRRQRRRAFTSITRRIASQTRRSSSSFNSLNNPDSGRASTPCSAVTRLTTPKIGRCSMSRCVHHGGHQSSWTAVTSSRMCTKSLK